MARPLRLEFAGALYHVTSRGNRCEIILNLTMTGTPFCQFSTKCVRLSTGNATPIA
jgi:hypothetical protein